MPPELLKALSELMRNPKTSLFGNVLSRLQVVIDHTFEAIAAVRSDGCLVYNPSHQSAQGITNAVLKHVMLHEASHILLKHLHRITPEMAADPTKMRIFNIAADMALEHLLASVSTDYLPEHHALLESILPKRDWNKPMEQLVNLIDPNHPQVQQASMDLNQLSSQGKKALQDAINKSIGKAAAQASKGAGKSATNGAGTGNNHSALLNRVMASYMNVPDLILKPLKRHFQVAFGEESQKGVEGLLSQRNLLRRQFAGLPMLGRNKGARAVEQTNKEQWHSNVTLLMDVSGSVNSASLQACLRFVQRLTAQHDVFPIRVLTFNSNLKQEFEIIDSTSIESVASAIKIGGGTNIINAINQADIKSKLTLVFTDMDARPVTPEDITTKAKIVFVAYDYYRNNFADFTAGETVDGNPMVDLFR
ncbi:VWA-like domain-containing protein [Crocinitomicaceae bacterium]|nr:VWA-like domain-containing protein [Crocinitomicaceae bacterium]